MAQRYGRIEHELSVMADFVVHRIEAAHPDAAQIGNGQQI